MAQFTDRPKLLPDDVLDRFKYEVSQELGLMDRVNTVGWPDMTARECGRVGGKIGGRMVRILIRRAEEALANGARLE